MKASTSALLPAEKTQNVPALTTLQYGSCASEGENDDDDDEIIGH